MNINEWYTQNYKSKSSFRFESFRLALNKLYTITQNPLILETGTVRLQDDFGAGYSTYIFGECISLFGGHLITIDISEDNMKISKHVTTNFSKNITYITGDSLAILKNLNNEIDLLYLDSYDCPISGDASTAQLHNLSEFKLAEPNLKNTSLILIDDVDLENGGKAKLTHNYLKDRGYSLNYTGQQSLWSTI